MKSQLGWRYWVAASCCAWMMHVGSTGAETPVDTVRLGLYMHIARDVNRSDARVALEIWADELTRSFKVPARASFYSDITAMRHDFEIGRINMVVADAMTFVTNFKSSELAQGFAARLYTDASLLLLGKSVPGETTLSGKRVARVANDDLAALYLDILCMRIHGKTCAQINLVTTQVTNSHQAATRLLLGQVDLALINRHGFATAKELNPQLAHAGQVLYELAFDTQYFGFFNANVTPDFQALALQSIPNTHMDARGRQMLDVFKVDQLVLAQPDALRPFYAIAREHQALKSRIGGKDGRK